MLILEGYLGNLSSRKLALSVQLLGVRIFEVGACRCVIPRACTCAADVRDSRTRAVVAESLRCHGTADPGTLLRAAVVAHVYVVGGVTVEACCRVAVGVAYRNRSPGSEVGDRRVADNDIVQCCRRVRLRPRDGEVGAAYVREGQGSGQRAGLIGHVDSPCLRDVGVLGIDGVEERRAVVVGSRAACLEG